MKRKQQVIIKLLKKLEKYRNLAEGIGILLQAIPVDDNVLDGVVKIISDALVTCTHQGNKKKLEDAIILIRKIRQDEEKEKSRSDVDTLLEKI